MQSEACLGLLGTGGSRRGARCRAGGWESHSEGWPPIPGEGWPSVWPDVFIVRSPPGESLSWGESRRQWLGSPTPGLFDPEAVASLFPGTGAAGPGDVLWRGSVRTEWMAASQEGCWLLCCLGFQLRENSGLNQGSEKQVKTRITNCTTLRR